MVVLSKYNTWKPTFSPSDHRGLNKGGDKRAFLCTLQLNVYLCFQKHGAKLGGPVKGWITVRHRLLCSEHLCRRILNFI